MRYGRCHHAAAGRTPRVRQPHIFLAHALPPSGSCQGLPRVRLHPDASEQRAARHPRLRTPVRGAAALYTLRRGAARRPDNYVRFALTPCLLSPSLPLAKRAKTRAIRTLSPPGPRCYHRQARRKLHTCGTRYPHHAVRSGARARVCGGGGGLSLWAWCVLVWLSWQLSLVVPAGGRRRVLPHAPARAARVR